ncbi:MAG: hypothetical protein KTR14_08155, partial [Vampirovibrio sp.]|nr:hypothetical protein [Vampirovibrio sp.]
MTPNTKGQPSYIESATNPLVIKTAALKDRKARREQGQLLVEGRKCLEEAINAGCQIHHLFLREGEAEAFPSDHPSHNSSIPILVSEK